MDNNSLKKSTLIVATLTSFMQPFMMSAVNIALPAIQKEFSANAVHLSWVVTSYILMSAVFLVPFGKLADIHGRKKVYIQGILLFTISSFLTVFAQSVQMLIFLRCLQGVSSAMIATTGMAIITSVFPINERGKAIGISVSAVYIGLSSGPFIGGVLTQNFGWRSIFLIIIPFGLLACFLAVKKITGEWADAKGEKIDILGILFYCISLVAIIYGSSIITQLPGILTVVIGTVVLVAFIRWELKIDNPVFEIRLFTGNRVFAFSSLAAFIHYSATFAIFFLLSLYLQYIKGMSPQGAGLVLLFQPVTQAVFSPVAGKLSDRIEPGIIASAGMAFSVAGLFLLIFISADTTLGFLIGIQILLGFGFALFSSPNMNAIMSSVKKQYFGVAAGTVGTMRTVGMTFSMAIVTVVFSLLIGASEITPSNYQAFMKSFKLILIVLSVLCTLGIYFSLARGKLRQ
jgi:EmrB/QacA subfamily drug resistance transporter